MVPTRSEKPICAPPRLSEVSPTLPLKRLQFSSTDDGPLSSFQVRSAVSSSFNVSLLQEINGVMSLALCSQHLNTLDLPRCKPLVKVALPAILSARSFPFTPACLRQYTHRSFRRWMSTIGTLHSGLPMPLFTFCSKLIESVRMIARVV